MEDFADKPHDRQALTEDLCGLIAAVVIAGCVAGFFFVRQTLEVTELAVCVAVLHIVIFIGSGLYRNQFARSARDEYYAVTIASMIASAGLAMVLLATHRSGLLLQAGVSAFCVVLIVGAVRASRCKFYISMGRAPKNPGIESLGILRTPPLLTRALKRVIDIVGALAAVAIFGLPLLIVAAAICLESGLPVFFRQARVCEGGRDFRIFKFRTMKQSAGDAWARPGDSRITRFGAILRHSSIDEIPQFLNVLKGEMSIVGPRPETRPFSDAFIRDDPRYEQRYLVKPGITGWSQVQMPRTLAPSDMPEVLEHDLFYVRHVSPFLDLVIILKTAVEFLFHRAV